MSELKGLIIPFLLGGATIAGVKYMAAHLNNPALAAILGGLPVGLLSIYVITSQNSVEYAHNYFYVTLILATAILSFYIIHIHTKLDKNIVLLISIVIWAVLVITRYLYAKYQEKKDN